MRFDRRELAGAVADVGVLIPIAVALIVGNGLSAPAVLLPAGLLSLTAAAVYRLPVPVQPLKAFGAIAIAKGLGSDEIAAGALLMGVVFVVLGRLRLLDVAARAFPKALIRGVQLTVGLLFLKIAWGLVLDPPKAFAEHALEPALAAALAAAAVIAALTLRRYPVSLVLVVAGVAVMAWLRAADAARVYFADKAKPVRPGRLATSFGSANLLAGALGGMPVCHGAGGLTAHVVFGARTAGAPLAMGVALVILA